MQIILASAKIMNDRVKSIPDISLSTPRFQNEAEGFARDMVQYSAESIAEMLGCSQQIAAQNRLRYVRFFDDAVKLPAICSIGSVSARKYGSFRLCSMFERVTT